jgi:Zn-dependent peptidase ImmA (M78 family)
LDLAWLKRVPTRELIRRGKVEAQSDKAGLLRSVLAFFGVSSVESWESLWLKPSASFRRSACFELKPQATAAWLRCGELEAIKMECKPFDKNQFKAALDEIRKLTLAKPKVFQKKMIELCAEAGVAVVFVPAMDGCPASGAARWLTPQKAIIQLSLRHKTDDHLWFSFFHEAGHILNDRKRGLYIDDGSQEHDEREKQANTFARNYLIPVNRALELADLRKADAVRRFANSIAIAPGIVVGRLQHDKLIPYSYLNHLKQNFEWSIS